MNPARRHVGGAGRGYHGVTCYCGRPARWHVMYGSGCGHVCGIHRRVIERRRAGTTARPLTEEETPAS